MQAVSQQVANKKKPASTAQRASRSTAAVPSFIADSPRITAQRQQIGSAFGSALQAKPKEKPKQLMASANVLQTQGEKQSPARTNHTGLPDNLKSGIESLSGMSMDSVRVHYNSAQPAQLNALAYAQGTDIHVAPGQEQHLPHEAWHVVQQAQGRVQPTMYTNEAAPVNDDKGLEHEADVRGAQAKQLVIQRALPPEEPDTGGLYNAQRSGDNLKIYNGGRPAKFSVRFKEKFLALRGATLDEDGMLQIALSYGGVSVLPANAISIDHITSWDSIEEYLVDNYAPDRYIGTAVADKKGNYTNYAAKMYYHDIDNLQPMAPSDNSGKGNMDVDTGEGINVDIATNIQIASGCFHVAMNKARDGNARANKAATKEDNRHMIGDIVDAIEDVNEPLRNAAKNLDAIKIPAVSTEP